MYALLTIGDGLVAQIPALLLSTGVAVIVTRMSREQDMGERGGRASCSATRGCWASLPACSRRSA